MTQHQKNPLTQPTFPPAQQGACFISMIFALLLIFGMVAAAVYLLKTNDVIVSKFEGKRWDIPAKVYSQPLSLYQGGTLSLSDLRHTLKLLNYKKSDNYSKTGTYSYQKGHYFIHTRGFDFGDSVEKSKVIKLKLANNRIRSIQSTKLTDSGIVRLEPVLIGGIYPDNNEDRMLVQLKQVPQPLIDALLATEDRSFYQHKGVSVRGTARALVSTVFGGKRQGGSTITQQLIKNFYLNSERTLKRKANEAVMAILLELQYSKQDILQAYLNEINLGQNGNRSINGFALAAQFYFNQPLGELSTDKLALLVGLAKGPSFYNPRRKPENALNRRNTVLNNMVVTGTLSESRAAQLKKQPLGVVKNPVAGKNRFPDFLNVVRRQLKEHYKEDDLKSEGLRIFTTLNPVLQKRATESFDASIAHLRKRSKKVRKLQGALVTANPTNGELLAVVGGYGSFTGYNRALEAKRQVGSLLKPMVFLNALSSGKYTLVSHVDDNPITLKIGEKTWSPQNYDKQSHGYVPLYQALAKSYNQATVRIGMETGISSFKRTLRNMGITEKLPNYPSIMLGAIDLTPMQVLGLYQTFAGNGFRHPINSIRSVVNAKGKPLTRNELAIEQSIDPEHAYVINHALQKVVSEGTARTVSDMKGNPKLAGKTGTTNNYKDAWFAGYSGNYVTVVWVGNDDNSATGLSGSSGALPVWKNYMRKLTLEPVNLAQPREVNWLWLENGTGKLTDERCPDAKYVPVQTKFTPTETTVCAQNYYQQDNQPIPNTDGDTTEDGTEEKDSSIIGDILGKEPVDIIQDAVKGALKDVIGGAAEWF